MGITQRNTSVQKMESDSCVQHNPYWIFRVNRLKWCYKYLFSNSLERYELKYVHYIGDRDTNLFKKVVDATFYGNITPTKTKVY